MDGEDGDDCYKIMSTGCHPLDVQKNIGVVDVKCVQMGIRGQTYFDPMFPVFQPEAKCQRSK